jgi:hypothetical protein
MMLMVLGRGGAAYAQQSPVTAQPQSLLEFGSGLNGPVNALIYNNDTWFAGGEFTSADGILVNNIARWTNNEWRSLQSGLNGPVFALGVQNNFVYVGGDFTEVGSQTVNHVVRWDGVSWQALGAGVNGIVRAIQVHNGSVYIGGDFTSSGGTGLNNIARWTGTQWESLGSGLNAPVHALYSVGNDLIVGGVFTTAGGAAVNRIARWNGTNWSAIGEGLGGSVHAITQHAGELVVGGAFSGAVSSWNGTVWSNVGVGINGTVYTISSDGDDLVIGGAFTSSSAPGILNVANLENGVWSNPGSANNKVNTVVIRNEVIHMGGLFTSLAGRNYDYMGRLALDLPDMPNLQFPANNSIEVTTSPTFQWSLVPNAFSFQIQVSTSSGFESPEYDVLVPDLNKLQLILENGLTNYYYRVRAINNLGESSWSSVVSFRTRLAFPKTVSPTQLENGLGSNVVFNWSSVPQAQSYWFQLSNSPNFENTLIADESGLSQTTFTVSGLSDNNTYYWRLKAERVGSESDWSPISQFTVNLPPAAPLPISPENGLVNSDTLMVKFQWGPVLNANDFQIQISKSELFQGLEFDQITTATDLTIPRLQSHTTYYWRVRARNIGGESAWSNTRSLTTIISPPSQVLLASPSNNQNGVSLSPYMKWQKSLRADKYRIQISTTQSFASFVVNTETTDTTFQARDLIPNRTYYWRVRSSNSGGDGNWSTTFLFVTINASATTAPILSLPGNDAIDLESPIQLVWQPTSGASAYRVQLSLSADFTNKLVDSTGVQSTFYILPQLLTSERYYWRVSALNLAGESAWSETRTFRTVVVTPAVPVLLTPINNLENAKTPLLLDWSNVQGATSYSVEVSTDSSFETIVFSSNGQAASAYLLTALLPQTTYYWRVRARNLAGLGDWSEVWSFTTVVQVPDQVTLVSPANQLINAPIPVLLRWNPSPRSEGYRIQFSNIPDLNSAVLADINVTNTFYSVLNLNKGQTYYWRVAAFNSGGQGAWSQVRSFTTVPEPPLAPELLQPLNSLDYIQQPILMKWQTSSFVERYQLQLSLSIDFESQLVIDDPNITDTKLDLTGTAPLPFNTIHYWRVKAFNSSGESAWSEVWTFRTLPELPAPTHILNPLDGAQMVFMPLALQWMPAARAQGYDIQISETSRFDGELVVDAQNYNDVTLILSNLKPEQSYWARVASRNVSGLSAWSDTTQFRTAPKVPEPPKLVSPIANITNANRTQTFVWRSQTDADRYQFQISTLSDFSTVLLTSEERTDTTYTMFLNSFNQEYFWRVRALNVSGPGLWSGVNQLRTFLYPNQVTIQKSIPFANTRQSSYRLAAIGGDANLPIVFTFEDYGKQGSDWNAYAEIGSNSDGLSNTIEVTRNSSGFNLRPGRGFWILAKRDWIINQTLPSVTLTNQDTYRIPLNSGWNIIGNPFGLPVTWSAVQQLNSITDPIFAFEGLWVQSGTLQANTGYYFFNRSNLAELEIPYQPQSQVAAVASIELGSGGDVRDQVISLGLHRNQSPLGSISIRLADDATIGFDDHDHVAPPGRFSSANIALYKDDIHSHIKNWSSLSFPSSTTPISEKLVVDISESGEYELRIGDLPNGMDTYLFDAKSGRTLRFGSDGSLEMYLQKGSHTFDWVVGVNGSIDQHASSQLPQEFRLNDAYPNPFNPTTNLSFALPTDSPVRIQIFDITGRLVAVVLDRNFTAGYHQITWDASRLASGVYIIEMRAGSFRSTGKVALVK